ncbi:MAG TPA: hypothetical protein PK530_12800 [Anaerolineales bacterium]|nr:hypothetical protein [Anaerolineales bacterium]
MHDDMHDPLHTFRFLRDWIIASILAFIAGTVLSWYTARVGLNLAEMLKSFLRMFIPDQGVGTVVLSLPKYVVTTTNVGAVVGACLSLGQGWVLNRWVPWAKEWLQASLVGAALSYVLMAALNILAILLDPDPRLLKGLADTGLWIGVIMGLAQWRVLRKYTSNAFWWVIASVGLWTAGSTLNHFWGQRLVRFLSGVLVLGLRRLLGIRNAGALRPFALVQVLLWTFVSGVWGFIAGKVLAWLVSQPLEKETA